nr:hypothetical protein [Brevibacterium aurantiacum]
MEFLATIGGIQQLVQVVYGRIAAGEHHSRPSLTRGRLDASKNRLAQFDPMPPMSLERLMSDDTTTPHLAKNCGFAIDVNVNGDWSMTSEKR